MKLTPLVVFGILLCLAVPSLCQQSDKVLLTEVKALTLREGQMTKGRRTSPIPQVGSLRNKNLVTLHSSTALVVLPTTRVAPGKYFETEV